VREFVRVLGKPGTATVGTVVTNPVDGSTTLPQGSATQTT